MEEYFDVLDKWGEYTNEVATRKDCHEKGLWHKAVAIFIVSNDNKKVLLQKRSASKKLWPNLWDMTSGGHVLANELGYQASIRETKEEIGITLKKEDFEFIGATTSEQIEKNIINRHYNEYYIAHADIDINDVTLQLEEVQSVKWFDKQELIEMINNHSEYLTDKKGVWNYLVKYFEIKEEQKNK